MVVNYEEHQEKIDQKLLQKGKHYVRLRGVITIIILCAIGYFLYKNQYLIAGATFFGAAVVVALQNFVSSFFAYIYLTSTAQFEEGDVIKTGNPLMSVVGEVQRIGFFFSTVKEVDSEMLFTGKTISFPNNLILSGGIFNYTRKDLLFRHEFTILLAMNDGMTVKDTINTYRTIVMKEYYKTLSDDRFYLDSPARESNPKFDLKITEKGLECKTRVLVHFYKLLETNNTLMMALLDENQQGNIKLIINKD